MERLPEGRTPGRDSNADAWGTSRFEPKFCPPEAPLDLEASYFGFLTIQQPAD
mgnify:CR=1 FL=1